MDAADKKNIDWNDCYETNNKHFCISFFFFFFALQMYVLFIIRNISCIFNNDRW